MKAWIMAALAATTLALSMGVATAGENGGAVIMDGASPGYPDYEVSQRALRTIPGYEFGDAIAQVHYIP